MRSLVGVIGVSVRYGTHFKTFNWIIIMMSNSVAKKQLNVSKYTTNNTE